MEINYLAVLISGILGMALGMLWYGPLFGKAWMKLMGLSQSDVEKAKKQGMGKSIALGLFTQLLMAYVLVHFIVGWAESSPDISSLSIGLQTGFWLWLGLVATIQMHSVLWENKQWKHYWITVAYWFVTIMLMSAVLSTWR